MNLHGVQPKLIHRDRIRLSEKSFVLFFQYPPDEGRPLATSSLAQLLRDLKNGRFAA